MTVELNVGKVSANNSVLNDISLAFTYAAECLESQGYCGMAAEFKQNAHVLYEALNRTGYFDNVNGEY